MSEYSFEEQMIIHDDSFCPEVPLVSEDKPVAWADLPDHARSQMRRNAEYRGHTGEPAYALITTVDGRRAIQVGWR